MAPHGSMQDRPQNNADILHFASASHATQEPVSKNIDEPIWRYDYASAWQRAVKAAHMLK